MSLIPPDSVRLRGLRKLYEIRPHPEEDPSNHRRSYRIQDCLESRVIQAVLCVEVAQSDVL